MTGEEYILEYLRKRQYVDILDADFIDGFIEITGAEYRAMAFGAAKCPTAGRLLGSMYKQGILKRFASGLPAGDSSMGFPKWVYSYSLN